MTASQVFTDLLSNSPKHSPRFSPGYEGTENMFYFLIGLPGYHNSGHSSKLPSQVRILIGQDVTISLRANIIWELEHIHFFFFLVNSFDYVDFRRQWAKTTKNRANS